MGLDPIARALDVLGLLRAGGEWTAAELAGRLGVDVRSIRRDVQRLRRLGYPVEARPGPGSAYRLAAVQVPPLLFSDEEVTALVAGLRIVQTWMPEGDVARTALSKLEQVLPRRAQQRAAAIDLVTEVLEQPDAPIPTEMVGLLAEAVAADGRVRFVYTDQQGRSSGRIVHPYRHVLRNGRGYLVAYDLDRADWRLFRLDRIQALNRVPGVFRPPSFPTTSTLDWLQTDFGRTDPH